MTVTKTPPKPKTATENILANPLLMRDRVKEIDVTQENLTKERTSLLHALATMGFRLLDEPVEKEPVSLPYQQWEAGDIVRCIHNQDSRYMTTGKEYSLRSSVSTDGDVEILDDDNDSTERCFGIFEWVRRP